MATCRYGDDLIGERGRRADVGRYGFVGIVQSETLGMTTVRVAGDVEIGGLGLWRETLRLHKYADCVDESFCHTRLFNGLDRWTHCKAELFHVHLLLGQLITV